MTVRIICSQAHMYKIYYFSTDKLVITFEREILSDERSGGSKEAQAVPSRLNATSFSVLYSREMLNEKDEMLAQAIREEIKTTDTKCLDALSK